MILQAISEPVCIADHRLDVTVSISIAVHEVNSTEDATELMKKADIAMYAAKQAGRNGYRLSAEENA